MKVIETQLREGVARQGITGEAADAIVKSIASFALYGFPESHAASFALIVYASAYLKAYFPAAFYVALLNNQPMGFYHPATLVKAAQRRGVRFAPVDVQRSSWDCDVEEDGTIRLGLRYVTGLRRHIGEAIEGAAVQGDRREAIGAREESPLTPHASRPWVAEAAEGSEGASRLAPSRCPKCGCDDPSMLERVPTGTAVAWFCNTCAHDWTITPPAARFRSLDDFVARTGASKEELSVLAEIGALNAFGYHRREALWQIEKAVRPAGELFEEGASRLAPTECPLPPMTVTERLVADYAGTRLTIGPHPCALRRHELALRGVLRAADLPRERQGRRIRVAGTVITRQRPGTAKGFVFLTLEDETGIANIIVRPDLFARDRLAILEEPFLLVEGLLQNQEGVTSVRAERVEGIAGVPIDVESHDFY